MFSFNEKQVARVVYRPERHDPYDHDYLLEIAARADLGELFLVTDNPLPPGTVLALEIEATAEDGAFAPLRGRGIVCWRRRWSRPRGMQVIFFEIEGLGQARPDPKTTTLPMATLPALS